MTITIEDAGRKIIATFVKSEDAGYLPGTLLLDMPYANSEHISVYKVGRKWIEAYVVCGVCRWSAEHATRDSALTSAATEYAGALIDSEAMASSL